VDRAAALIKIGQAVIKTEADAVKQISTSLNGQFAASCELLLACTGRVVVCGVGKSGHIANKIAATLASTGTPAFFVHPAEALHGDLGMIRAEDVIIAVSYGGETEEICTLLPLFKKLGTPIIAMTGKRNSSLATAANALLHIPVEKEACPMGLAPTSSTTASLAMGDALAVAVLETRGFNANDFAMTHPGGKLGKKLLLSVSDVMVTAADTPMVASGTSLRDSLYTMTKGQLGFLTIVDSQNKLIGVFSDGDLRRALDKDIDIKTVVIDDIMTSGGHTIESGKLAADALSIMEEHKIYALPVVDKDGKVCGALNMHNLFQAGLV